MDIYVGSYDSSNIDYDKWEYSDTGKRNKADRNKTTCEFSSTKRVKKGLKKDNTKKNKKNNARVLDYIKKN